MAQHDDHLSVTLTITGGKVEPQITELQDDLHIKDYNLQPFSEVALSVEPYNNDEKFTIQVMLSVDCSENVRVRETMSVAKLKGKVEKRFGPGECTASTRLGVVMEDDFPLSAYYVNPNLLIEVTIKICWSCGVKAAAVAANGKK
ncbi:hypothetical protein SLEP1_g48541 [Rubroshorea leprosula]|uniref:Ubiquitin-like domain-containing protein n=1 Tax=Rubroshorea leprosula TaxID=152421 RepID=A0AAV5LTW9_9ROSI|nr:hypothetical protein SLEP1_g48541 [Rubroshorea leprosula]